MTVNNKIEHTILRNLFYNDEYTKKVLPFLKEEYFPKSSAERVLFTEILTFILKYNNLPTPEAISVVLEGVAGISETSYKEGVALLEDIQKSKDVPINQQWLLDTTEKFCQEKALYNAMSESLEIMNNDNKSNNTTKSKGSIPSILTDALAISFDPNIGHDYINDAQKRFEFYHKKQKKFQFDLDYFNTITNGGIPSKTLNVIMGGTGGGKSLMMCHMAASFVASGYNVLYISLELSQDEIARRIDANLLNVRLDDLMALSQDMYLKKIENMKIKVPGKLIIRDFPTAGAGVLHFRTLLNELNLKKSFQPDIVFVDYLNICISSRIKMGSTTNSYTYVKAISEELRGLAVEYDFPLITGTQLNREGFVSSDTDLDSVSDSFGTSFTADLFVTIIRNDDLDALGQVMVKQLKNRYADVSKNRKAMIGIDKDKMKLFNLEKSAQYDIIDNMAKESNKIDKNEKYRELKI